MSAFKTILVGNVGKDAIVNIVNNKQCVNFSVAHSEKWKDAQGVQKEKTTWVSCAFWSEKTAIAQYIKKGTLVYIDGTVEATVWTNQQGQAMPQLNMKVWDIKLLSSNKPDAGNQPNAAGHTTQQVASDIPQDQSDLPF